MALPLGTQWTLYISICISIYNQICYLAEWGLRKCTRGSGIYKACIYSELFSYQVDHTAHFSSKISPMPQALWNFLLMERVLLCFFQSIQICPQIIGIDRNFTTIRGQTRKGFSGERAIWNEKYFFLSISS